MSWRNSSSDISRKCILSRAAKMFPWLGTRENVPSKQKQQERILGSIWAHFRVNNYTKCSLETIVNKTFAYTFIHIYNVPIDLAFISLIFFLGSGMIFTPTTRLIYLGSFPLRKGNRHQRRKPSGLKLQEALRPSTLPLWWLTWIVTE